MTYFKKKKIHLSEGQFFKLFDTKLQIRKKLLKIKVSTFSEIVLEIFSQSKNTWGIANLKNHFTLLYTFLMAGGLYEFQWEPM
jgi:hypothetical protein